MKKRLCHRFTVIGCVICIVMAAVLTAALFPVQIRADKMDLRYIRISVDEGEPVDVAAYEANYVNYVFVSMQDLAAALSGTSKQFDFYNDDEGAYHIDRGYPYDPSHKPEPETDPESEESAPEEPSAREQSLFLSLAANWTFLDDTSVNYYTFADFTIEDLYVSILDIQLMLDLKLRYENGIYHLNTSEHFSADLQELDSMGYFDYLHGVVLGDASTGEIIFSRNADASTPIASTTKLMTYLIAMRMAELGKIRMDDEVTISENAARLSLSDDSVIYMTEGNLTTVEELINAMMVGSSNESALALAEYISGSQEEFVKLMNLMAFRLGLESAVFYNPHGLPEYFSGNITTMVENRMSAKDLFKLSCAILRKYPQIEEITSQHSVWLEYLWQDIYATNGLLYNMPDMIGLKTGTTDAAGKCLVGARRVHMDDGEHILVSVVLGAEFNSDRLEISEMLLKSQGY